MADESYIQVAPDSTGKKVRTLEMPAVQSDGTVATVEMQVAALVDANGRPLDLASDLQRDILRVLKQLRYGLSLQLDLDLSLIEVE